MADFGHFCKFYRSWYDFCSILNLVISWSASLPTFRCNDSQKSPRMVHVNDLADLIDKKRKESKEEMEYITKKSKQKNQLAVHQ
ncbi:pyocin activator PrtN family protein [Xenorhabdus bovienii]|uniref:pyocin activator PrtN family protein n=1 Tax=Xenorhabdus bovienii TaxID=40576 RepID=UPI003DA545FD